MRACMRVDGMCVTARACNCGLRTLCRFGICHNLLPDNPDIRHTYESRDVYVRLCVWCVSVRVRRRVRRRECVSAWIPSKPCKGRVGTRVSTSASVEY